jgi:DNA-binding transcriptional MocR family regulator
VTLPVALVYETDFEQAGAWAVRVYAALAEHRHERTGRCDPSRKRLAEKLGCSVGRVRAALRELERLGWITSVERQGMTNAYVLHEARQEGVGSRATRLAGVPGGRLVYDPRTRRSELDAVLRFAQNGSAAAATDAASDDRLTPEDQLTRAREMRERYGREEAA